MTRLVVDTVIFIDAIFHRKSKPTSGLLLQIIESGRVLLLCSDQTCAEIVAAVALHGAEAGIERSRLVPPLMRVVKLLRSGEHVNTLPQFRGCSDPADNKFVDLALQGRAEYLITEDDHLRSLRELPMPVLTPWELLHRDRPDLLSRK